MLLNCFPAQTKSMEFNIRLVKTGILCGDRFQRNYFHDFMRVRSSSSLGSCSSLTESLGEWSVGDIEEDEGDTNEFDSALFMRSRLQSVGNDKKPSPISRSPPTLLNNGSVLAANDYLCVWTLEICIAAICLILHLGFTKLRYIMIIDTFSL